MAGIPGWEDDREAWDRLRLGGKVMAGYWRVECPVKRDMQKDKADGEDGVFLTDKGYDAADVTLTVRLTQDEWEDHQEAVKELHPRKKGGSRAPLEIDHPVTTLAGVTSIYIYEIGSFEVVESGDETGIGTQTFKAYEWFPQPKKAKGVGSGGGKFKSTQQVIEGPGTFFEPLTKTTDKAIIGDDLSDFLAGAL